MNACVTHPLDISEKKQEVKKKVNEFDNAEEERQK